MNAHVNVWTRVAMVTVALGLFAGAAVAPANAKGHKGGGGGEVLPANAKVDKYSLADAARATAVYNTGGPTAPDVPFAVVNGDVTVTSGASLYVPVFFADDSGVVDPVPFPRKLHPQDLIADYLIDAVNAFIHDVQGVPASVVITQLFVKVDGVVTRLDDDYVSGVTTPPLPDGVPAGTHYIVSAAFVSPLAPGQHTVEIGGVIDGEDVVFLSHQVTVTPAK